MYDRRNHSGEKKRDYGLGMTKNQTPHYRQSSAHWEGLDIQGLMKSFVGKIFSRSCDGDLDGILSLYDNMANMYQVSDEDTLKAVPVMLSGDALIYYL